MRLPWRRRPAEESERTTADEALEISHRQRAAARRRREEFKNFAELARRVREVNHLAEAFDYEAFGEER